MSQVTVGRGAPSERHTKRPSSSGAKTKSAGFSNQNGAAVKCRRVSRLPPLQEEPGAPRSLTFDLHCDGVLDGIQLVGGRADVFTGILERGSWDLNHLVEVLCFGRTPHQQVLAVLPPADVRGRPGGHTDGAEWDRGHVCGYLRTGVKKNL